jgi:tol-pal system protein YbgF
MLRLLWPCLVAVSACAGTQAASTAAGSGGSAAGEGDDRVAQMARAQDEQARRIGELEARLALLEADARHGRGLAQKSGETLRIGENQTLTAAERGDGPGAREPGQERTTTSERRPSLRLHGGAASGGRARAGGRADAEEFPPLPVTSERLPVVPLPSAAGRATDPDATSAAVSDPATSDYRGALRLLRARRFDEAALALSKFLEDNPDHALVDKAVYWRAEARYAKRDYRQALSEFETVLERFPGSEKAPDSLFKMGMCLRHLGVPDQARIYFRRVQTEYPNSEAASLASREDST